MIKNIFFDLDDTLLDFKAAERESLTATLTAFGIPQDEAVLVRYSEINHSCWEKLQRKEYTLDEVLTRRFEIFFSELGIKADVPRVRADYERRLRESARPSRGAVELLRSLQGKYRIFVVTNGVSRSQYSRISNAGIGEYIERVFVSEDVGCEKPDPEFFKRVLAELGDVNESESIIVGDSMTSDIPAGAEAGMLTCLYNPEGKVYTQEPAPDFEIKRLSELSEIIESIG